MKQFSFSNQAENFYTCYSSHLAIEGFRFCKKMFFSEIFKKNIFINLQFWRVGQQHKKFSYQAEILTLFTEVIGKKYTLAVRRSRKENFNTFLKYLFYLFRKFEAKVGRRRSLHIKKKKKIL